MSLVLFAFRDRARRERLGEENQENLQVYVCDGPAEAPAAQVQPGNRRAVWLSLRIIRKCYLTDVAGRAGGRPAYPRAHLRSWRWPNGKTTCRLCK